jgi:hypothetical protein
MIVWHHDAVGVNDAVGVKDAVVKNLAVVRVFVIVCGFSRGELLGCMSPVLDFSPARAGNKSPGRTPLLPIAGTSAAVSKRLTRRPSGYKAPSLWPSIHTTDIFFVRPIFVFGQHMDLFHAKYLYELHASSHGEFPLPRR